MGCKGLKLFFWHVLMPFFTREEEDAIKFLMKVHFLWLKAQVNDVNYYFSTFCKLISHTLGWTWFPSSNLPSGWLWDAKCCTFLGPRGLKQEQYHRKESGKRSSQVSYSFLFLRAESALLNHSWLCLKWSEEPNNSPYMCNARVCSAVPLPRAVLLTLCSPGAAELHSREPSQQEFSGVWLSQAGQRQDSSKCRVEIRLDI